MPTTHLGPDVVHQGPARGILHDKVEDVVGEVHVQQADDAGVLQARQHADLVLDLVYLGYAAEVAGIHRLYCHCLSCIAMAVNEMLHSALRCSSDDAVHALVGS